MKRMAHRQTERGENTRRGEVKSPSNGIKWNIPGLELLYMTLTVPHLTISLES